MKRTIAYLVLVAFSLGLSTADILADDVKRGFVPMVHKGADGDSKYVLFVPHGYTGDKEYPLILFLHGAGERGDDGQLPVMQGIANGGIKFKDGEKKFPFFVIFPQCKKNSNWKADGPDGQRALAILAEVQKAYKIDEKRLYLTGLSMGGFGTWHMAFLHPNTFAAIAPICGGGDPKAAETIKHIPCWCFCGDKDSPKLLQGCRDMVEALKKAGGNPRYSEYPFVGHNSWDSAYVTPELYTWFLSHKLK